MMIKTGAAMGDKFVGIHMIIILQKGAKVKGLTAPFGKTELEIFKRMLLRLLNWPQWVCPMCWLCK